MSEDLTKNLPSSDGEKLTLILSTMQRLDSTVERLDSRLGSLEQKVEVGLYDTRPIWEKVNTDIAELQAGQQRLEEGLEFFRGESRDVRTLLRDIFRRLSIFNDMLVTMQADYRDIYDRVREIERQR
jgi:predicted nuclease with TOPRIM domain